MDLINSLVQVLQVVLDVKRHMAQLSLLRVVEILEVLSSLLATQQDLVVLEATAMLSLVVATEVAPVAAMVVTASMDQVVMQFHLARVKLLCLTSKVAAPTHFAVLQVVVHKKGEKGLAEETKATKQATIDSNLVKAMETEAKAAASQAQGLAASLEEIIVRTAEMVLPLARAGELGKVVCVLESRILKKDITMDLDLTGLLGVPTQIDMRLATETKRLGAPSKRTLHRSRSRNSLQVSHSDFETRGCDFGTLNSRGRTLQTGEALLAPLRPPQHPLVSVDLLYLQIQSRQSQEP